MSINGDIESTTINESKNSAKVKVFDDESVNLGEHNLKIAFEITRHIKSLIINSLAGNNEEVSKQIAAEISNGRCAIKQSYNPPKEISRFNDNLKTYQIAGIHWLITLQQNGYNGIIADDMGLGKSAESICFLKYAFHTKMIEKTIVVACPTTLMDNWVDEFEKWAPNMKILKYHGSQNERKQLMYIFENGEDEISEFSDSRDSDDEDQKLGETKISEIDESQEIDNIENDEHSIQIESGENRNQKINEKPNLMKSDKNETEENGENSSPIKFEKPNLYENYLPDINFHAIVTSHQTLASSYDRQLFFKQHQFDMLIVDEAHSLKNASSTRYKRISKALDTPRKLLLTGSPIQNQLSELKNLLDFLKPYGKNDRFDMDIAANHSEKIFRNYLETEQDSISNEKTSSDQIKKDEISNGITDETKSVDKLIPSSENEVDSTYFNKNHDLDQYLNVDIQLNKKIDPEIVFYQEILSPLILRRLKKDAILNFSNKISKIELLELDLLQLALYHRELKSSKEFKSTIFTEKLDLKKKANQSFVKALLFRLRRICNHPLLSQFYFSDEQRLNFANYLHSKIAKYQKFSLDKVIKHISEWSDYDIYLEASQYQKDLPEFIIPDEFFLRSCKVKKMLELVDDHCGKKNDKVLIFSQFTTYLDIIEDCLNKFRPQFKVLRLDGSTVIKERSKIVADFQNMSSSCKIFLLSTKAGGVGLNLTSGNIVILIDQDWNPHNDRQAEDRVHRLGQSAEVTIYRLCCKYTFEETILSCCKKKLELDEAFGGTQEAIPIEILEQIVTSDKSLQSVDETIIDIEINKLNSDKNKNFEKKSLEEIENTHEKSKKNDSIDKKNKLIVTKSDSDCEESSSIDNQNQFEIHANSKNRIKSKKPAATKPKKGTQNDSKMKNTKKFQRVSAPNHGSESEKNSTQKKTNQSEDSTTQEKRKTKKIKAESKKLMDNDNDSKVTNLAVMKDKNKSNTSKIKESSSSSRKRKKIQYEP